MNYEALPGIADALEQVHMYEAKKKESNGKPKRWWDDDGDGKGYEKGEVDGSFKKEEFELEEGKNKEGKEQGIDGKACWKGYKYTGTENGKDKCVPANEELEAIEANLIESGLFSVDEVRYIIGEKFDELEEATAMAKRGYDETKLRKRAGGGEAADRATALEKKSTFGDANKAKQRSDYARKQRGDYRNTASSSPGLHGYGHQSNDPKVKAKQAARGAQRGALTPNEKKDLNMGYEFDGPSLEEQEAARNNPEKYERDQQKKSAPVRGERTPMPPRGDKRREDFEKWYAKNVR